MNNSKECIGNMEGLFKIVKRLLIAMICALIITHLFGMQTSVVSVAGNVQKTIKQKETINRRGLADDLEVGDYIDELGMKYVVTSTYPRTATFVYLDIDSEEYYDRGGRVSISDEVLGDDLQHYKVTAISSTALCNESKVKTVYIGDNIKTIGASAFEGCKNLKEVYFGKRVKKIGEQAFYNCPKLKTIDLYDAKSLKSVGKNAFKKIHKKYKIYCKNKYKKKYQKLFKGKIGP